MIRPTNTNIVELLGNLVNILQPVAQSNGITLRFESSEKNLVLYCRVDIVIHDITDLICRITSYVPPENSISLVMEVEREELKISIKNTGINLSRVAEITHSCKQKMIVRGNNVLKQTEFWFQLPLTMPGELRSKGEKTAAGLDKKHIPEYYDEIRKRLKSHFSKADTLVAQLSILYPKEAEFLQKVNAVIIANIENEFFDSSVLSREMNMSRTQLFRRLKPLIQQPPAKYIKSIRLQKAKELLETTDITVGDAAFKTGFQTQSHFTKAFLENFGFRPSAIKRKNGHATKE